MGRITARSPWWSDEAVSDDAPDAVGDVCGGVPPDEAPIGGAKPFEDIVDEIVQLMTGRIAEGKADESKETNE